MSDEEYVTMVFNYEMNRDIPLEVEEWEESEELAEEIAD